MVSSPAGGTHQWAPRQAAGTDRCGRNMAPLRRLCRWKGSSLLPVVLARSRSRDHFTICTRYSRHFHSFIFVVMQEVDQYPGDRHAGHFLNCFLKWAIGAFLIWWRKLLFCSDWVGNLGTVNIYIYIYMGTLGKHKKVQRKILQPWRGLGSLL